MKFTKTTALCLMVLALLMFSAIWSLPQAFAGPPIPIPVPTPTPRPAPACAPTSGCVLMESGTNARWWPDSVKKAKCANQKDTDWLVTYKTDNQTWRKADPNKIRIYSDNWWARTKIRGQAQIQDPYPPGITLCIGGSLSESEAKSVWVWLK